MRYTENIGFFINSIDIEICGFYFFGLLLLLVFWASFSAVSGTMATHPHVTRTWRDEKMGPLDKFQRPQNKLMGKLMP